MTDTTTRPTANQIRREVVEHLITSVHLHGNAAAERVLSDLDCDVRRLLDQVASADFTAEIYSVTPADDDVASYEATVAAAEAEAELACRRIVAAREVASAIRREKHRRAARPRVASESPHRSLLCILLSIRDGSVPLIASA